MQIKRAEKGSHSREICFFVPRDKEEEPVVINLPDGWAIEERRMDGVMCYSQQRKMVVIASIGKEKDNKWWLHVSVSCRKRMPNHDEMKYVKENFIGEDRYAVAVWPPKKEYVNIHPNCLHLWCCLDEYPLPDFTHGLGTI